MKVQLQSLNAMDTSDIFVTCNMQFITVESLDTINKVIYISTPPYDGSKRSVVITVKSTGGAVRTASFTFTYVGSGPLTVLSVSAREVARSMDLDVLVSLKNFPKLEIPFNKSRISFVLQDFDVRIFASSIVSSTSDATVAALKVPPVQNGQWPMGYFQVRVFETSSAGQNEATFKVLVIDDPTPTISSISPEEIDCSVSNSFVLGIKNLPPLVRSTDLKVSVDQYPMTVDLFQSQGLLASMTLGLSPIPSCMIGNNILSIRSLTDSRININTTVVFKAKTSAKLLLYQPTSFYLGQSRDVQIYLENFPSAACVDCVQEAYQSLFVCDGKNGTLKSVRVSQGKTIIVATLPVFKFPGTISCSLFSSTVGS